MSAMTDDVVTGAGVRTGTNAGLVLALTSAVSFGLSGSLATSLFAAGWSTGAVSLVRVAVGALIAAPLGFVALRGRWGAVRDNLGVILGYGLMSVAGAQFSFFAAIQHMDVGPALLIEYTAPATVVGWMWLRHGQRPGPLTLAGAAVAVCGLVLVLNLVGGGGGLDPIGVAWALAGMTGTATYFIVIGTTDDRLPSIGLAACGLVVGALALGLLGAVGLLPFHGSDAPVHLAGVTTAWWIPLLGLGVISCGLAYLTGVGAGRLLGARLASFVALVEVVAGVGFAWLLLGQWPAPIQLLGGLLIVAGVVSVRMAERD